MIAFEDDKDATVHFYVHRGTPFEITETIEVPDDGQRLIRRERITASDASEQTLTAELPVLRVQTTPQKTSPSLLPWTSAASRCYQDGADEASYNRPRSQAIWRFARQSPQNEIGRKTR